VKTMGVLQIQITSFLIAVLVGDNCVAAGGGNYQFDDYLPVVHDISAPVVEGRQNFPCLLQLRETDYADNTDGSDWNCWVFDTDAVSAGAGFGAQFANVEIKGIDLLITATNNSIISGTTTFFSKAAALEDHKLILTQEIFDQDDYELGVHEDSRRRRLASSKGQQRLLVVRVTTKDGQLGISSGDVSNHVFGTHGDKVNFKTNIEECSNNKAIIKPATASGSGCKNLPFTGSTKTRGGNYVDCRWYEHFEPNGGYCSWVGKWPDVGGGPHTAQSACCVCGGGQTTQFSNHIVDGVFDMSVNIDAQNSNRFAIEEAVHNELVSAFHSSTISSIFDLVMICVPHGSYRGKDNSKQWRAYAYVGGYLSVYNGDENCINPAAQGHEVGHNWGLRHSSDLYDNWNVEYGDMTGVMGGTYGNRDEEIFGGKYCFNGAHSWQLGWYNDYNKVVNPLQQNVTVGLAGVAKLPNIGSENIVVKVEDTYKNYYVMYNHAVGANAGTIEAINKVTVTSKVVNTDDFTYLEAKLSRGDHHTIPDFQGSGQSITIHVIDLDDSLRGSADVEIYRGTINDSPYLAQLQAATPAPNPTAAPTSPATAAPTATTQAPTVQQTVGPTEGPTSRPTFRPTGAPTFVPTYPPTEGPTYGPTSSPTETGTDKKLVRGMKLIFKGKRRCGSYCRMMLIRFMKKRALSFFARKFGNKKFTVKNVNISITHVNENTGRFRGQRQSKYVEIYYDEEVQYVQNGETVNVEQISRTQYHSQSDLNGLMSELQSDPEFADVNQILCEDTSSPTSGPTSGPSMAPTSGPTTIPTSSPSMAPTSAPTHGPTFAPTLQPTAFPTSGPTFGPTASPPTAESNGDPHFKTWKNEHFEYHGQCDLVMISKKDFANSLGIDIHIRTKIVRFWSYIQRAAIRIGNDILEVEGSMDMTKVIYWINYEYMGELTDLGGFPVTINENTDRYTIDLGKIYPGQQIQIKTFKEFVGVKVIGATEESFGGSVGIIGDFKSGNTYARDGSTVLHDFDSLGNEWQVLPGDGRLFLNTARPQFPEKCWLPEESRGERKRQLKETYITNEQAEAACAELEDDFSREGCVFDILTTQDLDMVGAYR